ncbi:MAG TPA: ATP-binding protein [Spirochaetota bacterium]|nr:ATP-binding protein [Spirochaetota bacterium]HOM38715.1 ATP-binding protein [Spirochaetota bacterium]HPQ49512.1 ATP-binding protein [Spirochaetota bacterium]
MAREVGIIIGNKGATPTEFFIGIKDPNYHICIDDIVYVEEKTSKNFNIKFYGIIAEIIKGFDVINFNTENFLVTDKKIPSNIYHIAQVKVIKIEPEFYVAPTPGNKVFMVDDEEIDIALNFKNMKEKVFIGELANHKPAYINLEFIDGRKGAHVSISGISGVATKTTFATFLMHSINSSKPNKNYKMIIFNVKGYDLLFIDKKNKNIDKETENFYINYNIKPEPFDNVGIYAPTRIEKDDSISLDSIRNDANKYSWDIYTIVKEGLFEFMFNESDDSNISLLIRDADKFLKNYFNQNPGSSIESISELIKIFENETRNLNDNESKIEKRKLFPNQSLSSISAFLRRLRKIEKNLSNIINREYNKINWENHKVTIIDIHNLSSPAQLFVVSSVIKEIFEEKEEKGLREPVVFIMIDELNKYAPSSGSSPIKDILIDIAERGRSLGIILIGAQQTADAVEKRVYLNSAIKVVGRLDSGDIDSPVYKYLGKSLKERAIILKQGKMIVHQPDIPYPLVVSFPYPVWATRPEETTEKEEKNKKTVADYLE